jgi:predicted flap endonuclease-1-like 5' DNA nuclease
MSVRVLLALIIGILLAAASLALLIWLLWKLWTRDEREKETAVVEFELEPEQARDQGPSQAAERFVPAAEELPPVPPLAAEPEPVPPPVSDLEAAPPYSAAGGEVFAPPVDVIIEEPAAIAPLPGAADDLKLIEGIGPKIASVLQEAGIGTFAQLAAADPDRLRGILREADPRLLRLADPATWPEQARLAAAGEWDALTELQGRLRGGRQRS